MPPPITGPGIGGAYMGGFLPAFYASRQAADTERTRGLESGLTALKLADLLRQRQNDEQAQSAVEQLVRNVQGGGAPGGAPGGGAALPAPTGISAGAPAALASAPALPTGATSPPATMLPGPAPTVAPRPSPLQSVLQGLEPGPAARLMTGRPEVLKTFEEAERERQTREDRAGAQEFFDQAEAHGKEGDAFGFYAGMAAGFRRLQQPQLAGQYMQYGMEVRRKEEEGKKGGEDLKALFGADAEYERDPTPEKYQRFLDTVLQAKSAGVQALVPDLAKNLLGKRLNPTPAIDLLFRDAGQRVLALRRAPGPVTDEAVIGAWADAMDANPAGMGEIMKQYALGGEKAKLPDVILKALKLPSVKVLDAKNAIEVATHQMADLYPDLHHNDADPAKRAAYWKQFLNIEAENEHRLAMEKERPDTALLNKAKLDLTKIQTDILTGKMPPTVAQATALLGHIDQLISRGDFASDAEYIQMQTVVRQQVQNQLLDAVRREQLQGKANAPIAAPTPEQLRAAAKERARALGEKWDALPLTEQRKHLEAVGAEARAKLQRQREAAGATKPAAPVAPVAPVAPAPARTPVAPAPPPKAAAPVVAAPDAADIRIKQIAQGIARERGLDYAQIKDRAARLEILQQASKIYEQEQQLGPPKFNGK